jgi:hypothetical protein
LDPHYWHRISRLTGLHDLASLDLSETSVTGEGLKGLANLQALSALDLGQTKVTTDAHIRHLTALKSLNWLSLSGSFKHWSMITDAGLQKLAAVKSLSDLHLGLSNVTESGVRRFQAALPNCRVSRSYAGPDWEVTTKVGPA